MNSSTDFGRETPLQDVDRLFDGKSILITGGTGSFGVRYIESLINRTQARRIAIFSRDEQKHYNLQQRFPNEDRLRFFIGDVRDYDRLTLAMSGVDLVIHAAAMKHVPLAEYNPFECLKTNVQGAEMVIRAAIKCDVEKVIALSTDKAANPINLYGSSKLASDKCFVAANNMTGSQGPRFSVVRYGNVVGSNGSVVPFFQSLIDQGAKKLPITHKDMTRFWITLQQGVDFVFENFARMHGGEIFVPKIPSVYLTDLAKAMLPNCELDFVGIRPGEKLHEVMCPRDDSHLTLEFADHFVIEPTIKYWDRETDFSVNALGSVGKRVEPQFEYRSNDNNYFLSVEEVRKYNQLAAENASFRPFGVEKEFAAE
ncbi:UDP-N-acetylglucosamine 4,6-dehydratase (inverting) [Cognatiyoonia sp. IB215446]|uniref:UDP-N-acetylglucosamine 4,6-dehydratase (inverting) n=1 Tax=Cognatiyoonia sp. IB215446 TaxID=3097355 RepID=UPI002A0FC59E|nr:UDP-N-acetylglucosamine 4,6-dehydratase (inverting) [Cognatiyoonia sp. IB215446]MDX8349435.1 UDP-N-acetylglucosamine 4,6-dehydratase (inverting) [Cognatiyoonia sp. IB215446]